MPEEINEKENGCKDNEENTVKTEANQTQNNTQDNETEFEHKINKLSNEDLKKEYKKLLKTYDKLGKEQEKIKEQLTIKEAEAADYLDKYRRSLAEAENIRKRFQNDRQESAKYANFKIIEDFLVILDDLQRAIESAKAGSVDFEKYQQGIEMIEKQFLDLLFKKYGVVKYAEAGEAFDPNKHQALMMEVGEYDKEVIIEIFRRGYQLHDRVIRHAQVKVGKPA
jgi:molecular chaperone GrpE